MTNFAESDHPRATTGVFTDKQQSAADVHLIGPVSAELIDDDEPRSMFEINGTIDLRIGEREIDDRTAMSIAGLADKDVYPVIFR